MNEQPYPSGISQSEAERIINEADIQIFRKRERTNRHIRDTWKCKTCYSVHPKSVTKCYHCELGNTINDMNKKSWECPSIIKDAGLVVVGFIVVCIVCAMIVVIGNAVTDFFISLFS